MKIQELLAELSKLPADWDVVLSSDAEGNSFSQVAAIDDNVVFDGQDVGLRVLTPALRRQGFSEEDVGSGRSSVVLYPV